MKPLPWIAAETYRWPDAPQGYYSRYGDDFGVFMVRHNPTNVSLKVIVGAGEGWEHVSVSLPNRCPNWPEMHFVKELFWSDNEAVMQLHPPQSDYRNCHPYCLHLWRPIDSEIPLPPGIMVAPDESVEVAE